MCHPEAQDNRFNEVATPTAAGLLEVVCRSLLCVDSSILGQQLFFARVSNSVVSDDVDRVLHEN
jgi:hypothetical protein